MIQQNGVWDYGNVISYHEARKISRSRVKFFDQLKDVISHFLKASPSLDNKHLANCSKENNQLDVLTNVFCSKTQSLMLPFLLSSLVTNPADDMCVCMRRGAWKVTAFDRRRHERKASVGSFSLIESSLKSRYEQSQDDICFFK